MSIRRMMLFTLGGFFKSIISLFKSRVLSDSGTFENENQLEADLNNIGSQLFNEASLVITPNAVKTSKLYAVKPDNGSGDLTVTRATTATRINASGVIETVPTNTARIDYSTGKGMILVEPQRTNLLLRSEEFDNSYWSKNNLSVVPNSIIAPDGTLTADKLVENASDGLKYINRNAVGTSNNQYTLSVYLKQGERSWVFVTFGYDNSIRVDRAAFFNLSNGTIGSIRGDVTATIENV